MYCLHCYQLVSIVVAIKTSSTSIGNKLAPFYAAQTTTLLQQQQTQLRYR
jgi:hypothetical protein